MSTFPEIYHIDQVLPSVEGREDFIHGVRDGYQFLDYAVTFPDTFLDPWEAGLSHDEVHRRLLRLECRGIKFYPDGYLAARPFHKFFNIGEKEWTQPHVIDWSEKFVIFEKLDGSMIHPLWLDGEMYFATRMGITEIAEDAKAYALSVANRDYYGLCKVCDYNECTPLFEWCTSDPYKRIVIKHPEDKLILTAIRFNRSGQYASRAAVEELGKQFCIPVVEQYVGDWGGIERFLAHTKALVDSEGYVIDFDGTKYKTKGDWYLAIHRAKDAIQFEKDVVSLIIEGKLDDILPSLLEEDRDRLLRFELDFWNAVHDVAEAVAMQVSKFEDECPHDELGPRKRWIAERIKTEFKEPLKGLAFAVANGKSMRDHVIKALRFRVGSGPRLREMSALFGDINWLDYF